MQHLPAFTSREDLLENVGEEWIFTKYGLSPRKGRFCNPFRADPHPGCYFFRGRNGKLYFRDQSQDILWDCFDVAAAATGLNKFSQLIQQIARDFGMKGMLVDIPQRCFPKFEPDPQLELRIQRCGWDAHHMLFWKEHHIKPLTLDFYKIYCIQRAWLNDKPIYNKHGLSRGYAYHFPQQGPFDYKFYFPDKSEYRFFHARTDILQGWAQLPPTGDLLVITKSLKDVVCLYEAGIAAVAPMSETTPLGEEVLDELKSRFSNIICMMDWDSAGIRYMANLRRKGIPAFRFADKVWPRKGGVGGMKDPADYCRAYGLDKFRKEADLFLEQI